MTAPSNRGSRASNRRVAIRVPNWLGDAVMALPAIQGIVRGVEAEGGGAVLVLRPGLEAVFDGMSLVVAPRGREIEAVRSARVDRILLLAHSFSTAWAAWRAGVPERWGEGRHLRSSLLSRVIPRARGFLHQVDEYARIANEAGYGSAQGAPRLPEQVAPDRSLLGEGPYIVLAPGARYGAAKRWPGFTALARHLAGRGERVVILGAAGEGFSGAPDGDGRGEEAGRILDLAGRTSLAEAIRIVAHSRGVVANDSGLAHVAAATGRRVVVVFGPTDPERTAPRAALGGHVENVQGVAECAPCLLRTCPIDHRCLAGLGVGRVVEALDAALDAAPADRHRS